MSVASLSLSLKRPSNREKGRGKKDVNEIWWEIKLTNKGHFFPHIPSVLHFSPLSHHTKRLEKFESRTDCVTWSRFLFVEDTLWTGNPGNYTNPEAPKALAEVRKLVDDGQYAKATTEAVKLSGIISEVRLVFSSHSALNISHRKMHVESCDFVEFRHLLLHIWILDKAITKASLWIGFGKIN